MMKKSFIKADFTKQKSSKSIIQPAALSPGLSRSDLFELSQSSMMLPESDGSIIRKLLKRFPNLSRTSRQNLVIDLIRLCDPLDMQYLSKKIPKLHRDFIALLPKAIVHRILGFMHPRDFCNAVQVSTSWAKTTVDIELWQKLYAKLGLVAMSDAYYLPHMPMLVNAKRLYSLGNWAKGVFTLKRFKAHPLGILCVAFDGRYIAVRFCVNFGVVMR